MRKTKEPNVVDLIDVPELLSRDVITYCILCSGESTYQCVSSDYF